MHQSERNLSRARIRTAEGDVVELFRDRQGPCFERWLGKGGHMSIQTGGFGVVRITITNHGDGRFTAPMLRGLETTLERWCRLSVFFDFERMDSYDTQLRLHVTDWCREHRQSIDAIHVLGASKIVRMGISIANIALGGMIEMHRERASYEHELRKASG